MKTCLRLAGFCGSLVAVLVTCGHVLAQYEGGELLDPGNVQPSMAADLLVAPPGRLWVEANLSEDGLGYNGSYFTLGGKTHVAQDWLDGRWLLEAQGHLSLEEGGFFSNIGIERAFSLAPAGADISASFWFDYDSDQQGDFAHTFYQWSVNGTIKTRRWDLVGNGYFPFGSTDFAQGDPTGEECFLDHSIVLVPAIDSALRGFDALWKYKPESLGQWNGYFGIGGYGYSSDLVEFFGGVRLSGGAQLLNGLIISTELNHDDRFDFTGVLQLAWMFGGNARGTEYGLLGSDLAPTVRNDHIVRYRQDLVLAIDPDTGLPYNVFHVDNTADPAFADGTAETPFVRLKDAELASGADAIIFVREGTGTTFEYDEGIVLKDGQLLLGDGVQHLIPIQGGILFELCNDQDGNRPVITNEGGPVVTLANRNTVRGFVIDGAGGILPATNGIEGVGGAGSELLDGTIEDVTIIGNPILNGVFLDGIAGDWRFARNDFNTAGFDGLFIDNVVGPASTLEFVDNSAAGNGRDGIHIEDFDGSTFVFDSNSTDDNGRHGVRMERFVNSAGTGADINFLSHSASGNVADGISLELIDGDLLVTDSTLVGNFGNGIGIVDFTNSLPTQQTLIEDSLLADNGGAGISNSLTDGGLVIRLQELNITGNTIEGNRTGISSGVEGLFSTLTTNVVDNLSVSGNLGSGMEFRAEDDGTHFVLVENTTAPLDMIGNGTQGGDAISFLAANSGGAVLSTLDAEVRNVNIDGTGGGISGDGIFAGSQDESRLTLSIEDVTINGTTDNGINVQVDNATASAINSVAVDNVAITNTGGTAVLVNSGSFTFLDLALTNMTLDTGGRGLDLSATGTVGGAVDNRTRLLMQNVSINNFTFDGGRIEAFGDAHILALIEACEFTNNGVGAGGAGNPTLPFFDGLRISATGSSQIHASLTNNLFTGNFERGLRLESSGTAVLNALLTGNAIAGNDVGEDPANDPIIDNGFIDFTATNSSTGTAAGYPGMSLAFSETDLALAGILTNLSAPVDFVVELDGVTNDPFIFVPGPGAFTFLPFGSVCEPAFLLEEADFIGAGFPP